MSLSVQAQESVFKLCPNVTNYLTKIVYNKVNKDAIYRIIDEKGVIIEEKKLKIEQHIDLTNYKSGIYFVSIIDNNRIITRKLIKI